MINKMPDFPDFKPREFGFNTARFREFRGFTQKDFAASLDISEGTLRNIESGKSDVSLKMAFTIAKKLDFPIKSLLHLDDNAIVNSFNQMSQDGDHQLLLHNSSVSTDREHIDTLRRENMEVWTEIRVLREENHKLREENQKLWSGKIR